MGDGGQDELTGKSGIASDEKKAQHELKAAEFLRPAGIKQGGQRL